MATEIPNQFTFQHILSHTFPGFFSAITLFMLFDIISNINLTSFMFSNNLEGLIVFAGFVLLIGSILGIIIDGIHHTIIERMIFEKELKRLGEIRSGYLKEYGRKINNNPDFGPSVKKSDDDSYWDELDLFYLYSHLTDKLLQANDYIEDGWYSYSEFYCNTFISLIAFSFVAPLYSYFVLENPSFIFNISISLLSCLFALLCIYGSFKMYEDYYIKINNVIRGYVDEISRRGEKQAI